MMRRVMAVAAFACLAVSPAVAQVPGFNLNLFPRIGVFQPSGQLCECNNFDVKLRGGIAIGLSAELALPLFPDIRANLDYAPKVGTTVDGDDSPDKDDTLLALTADLVLNMSPPLSPVKPYLLLGGGVKRYDFSSLGGTDSESDLTLHAGAGVGLKFGPLSLVGEASDYISWFKPETASSGKMQNDIFIMVGFKIGMF